MRKASILGILLVFTLTISFTAAETFGYGRTEVLPINYSLIPTVNNSFYWQGHTGTDGSWLTGIIATETLWNANSSSVARIGNCPAGQVVMNTTNSGVQCVTASTFPNTFWNITGDQTGLTGNKSGSFKINTSGTVELGGGVDGVQLIVRAILNASSTASIFDAFNKYGQRSFGQDPNGNLVVSPDDFNFILLNALSVFYDYTGWDGLGVSGRIIGQTGIDVYMFGGDLGNAIYAEGAPSYYTATLFGGGAGVLQLYSDGANVIDVDDGAWTLNGSYDLNTGTGTITTAKITSAGGVDPPYLLYDLHTRTEMLERARVEIPQDKSTGYAQFVNKDTMKAEFFIPSTCTFINANNYSVLQVIKDGKVCYKNFELKDGYFINHTDLQFYKFATTTKEKVDMSKSKADAIETKIVNKTRLVNSTCIYYDEDFNKLSKPCVINEVIGTKTIKVLTKGYEFGKDGEVYKKIIVPPIKVNKNEAIK